MTGTDGTARFACSACGSPSIVLPAVLADEAVVSCGRCQSAMGSWLGYKSYVSRSIHAEYEAVPAQPMICVDPIIAPALAEAL